MPFKPPKRFPHFADLKNTLAQSDKTDHALYTTIQEIIERLDQFRNNTQEKVEATNGAISDAIKNAANKFATYHTKNDEIAVLPNSVQLLAGPGISFDDSIANKRTITSTIGATHYDAPLSDGDLIAADLIYAAGECIIVQVPV